MVKASRPYHGWDRDRARPAVGEGFPVLLFRLQAGSQSHHDARFSTPPENPGRPDFPGPVPNLGLSAVGLPMAWRGLNAGSCTPLPLLVCPQPRLEIYQLRECRFYQAGRQDRPTRPPSVQSPFAQLGCYLRWGDVIRLLRGHYSSVVARTGSCAAPVGLSPPSAFGLVWRVLAGCNQSLLPTIASRRISNSLFLDVDLLPGGTPCARAVSSTEPSAFPKGKCVGFVFRLK